MTQGSVVSDYLCPQADIALFTDRQWWDAFLQFESALAQAQAECGLVPPVAADAIAHACQSVALNSEAFSAQARASGALGLAVVQPLQQWLRLHRPEGVGWLHWGATTQDVVDTAQVLLTRQALALLQKELTELEQLLVRLAQEHAETPMLARTLLQPAQVTSFGFKCAQSAAAIARSRGQLQQLASAALRVQLGGAVGNNAALGTQAGAVEQALAQGLGLSAGGSSWHTQRDGWMRLAMEVAVCSGTLAKLAGDWALMQQYEVGELRECMRGSTSSAMPHKRNPVHCMQALAQTQTIPQLVAMLLGCMAQQHERGLGSWQAEVAHWGSLWRQVHAAALALRLCSEGLQVNPARMRAHIEDLQGVIASEALTQTLAYRMGKPQATAAVAACALDALAQQRPLPQLLLKWMAQEGIAVDAALRAELLQAGDVQHAVQASAHACHALLQAWNPLTAKNENEHEEKPNVDTAG